VFEAIEYPVAIWLFAVAYALHEAEEWNSLGWHQRSFADLPPGETDRSIRVFLVLASVVVLGWAGLVTVWGDPRVAAYLFLPTVAVIVQNALQHVYWQLAFREYAPGIVTSVLLLIPGTVVLAVAAVQRDYVPLWYVLVLAILLVPGLIQTVRAGHSLTPPLRAILRFSVALDGRLRGD
jgi:asparagine N-glycosylation enzyme membrane subunit Stt3